MLPSRNRLHLNQDIKNVLRHGKRITTPEVDIYYRAGEKKYSRVATIVSKKVSLLATKRHHYQRWLRAIAAEHIKGRAGSGSYDMVWVARPAIKHFLKSSALSAHITRSFKRFL